MYKNGNIGTNSIISGTLILIKGIVAQELVTLQNSTSSEISFFQVLNDKFVFLQYTP